MLSTDSRLAEMVDGSSLVQGSSPKKVLAPREMTTLVGYIGRQLDDPAVKQITIYTDRLSEESDVAVHREIRSKFLFGGKNKCTLISGREEQFPYRTYLRIETLGRRN